MTGASDKPFGGDSPRVYIARSAARASRLAADGAASTLRGLLESRPTVRMMVGTGNSQLAMIGLLTEEPGIDWSRVVAFHLDEYVGLPASHPASFRQWIRTRFAEKVRPREIHYLDGDAADLDETTKRYSALLAAAPIDLAFVGIGENGHIAFNDPHVADFAEAALVKIVSLDDACRRQQVGEGHFPSMSDVPAKAMTVTCTGLLRAERWICCVPDARKAKAVKAALEGPVSPVCPASLVQRHPDVDVFLDPESAALLSPEFVAARARFDTGEEPRKLAV